MLGFDIYTLLYYLVSLNSVLVLLVGLVATVLYLIGAKLDIFWERIVPAVATLVGTSLAAGAIMWIGTKAFL